VFPNFFGDGRLATQVS